MKIFRTPTADLPRRQALHGEQLYRVNRETNRMFAWLLVLQWLAAVVLTARYSPRTWEGTDSNVHPHIWLATLFGGFLISLPLFLIAAHPQKSVTRHAVGISQMALGALFIHLSGGQIETHFHVFGSLAFLAFYRDWKVLLTATLVVALDHVIRGALWPQSIYGTLDTNHTRTFQHIAWVLFEDVFLIISINQSRANMLVNARQQHELEELNVEFEARVQARTRELKASEASLRAQQAEIRALFDLVPAMIWFKDTKNNQLRVNQRVADALGRPLEEIEGFPAEKFYPQEAAKFYADDLEIIRSGKPKLAFVESFHDPQGREVWVQTDKVPLRDPEGNVTGIVVMSQDITERRNSDELLRLLSSAMEQCNETVVITDANMSAEGPKIVFINPAFTAMTGYTPAEALGRSPRIIFGARTDPAVIKRLRDDLSQGRASMGETICYRKDGVPFDLEWLATPVRNTAGIVTHFVGIQRDVTARKAAELELVTAREAALESAQAKSRFLANMSHELRTPLNTVNGLSATLLEQELPPQTREAARLILQCGETLLEHIQTILTHSSLEAGKTHLDNRSFSPASVALKALRMTGEMAHRKGLTLDYYLDPQLPATMTGDPFRLQQILVNLLANAVKFTEKGRVCLRLDARARTEGTWELRFMISDTGVGIAGEKLPLLFKPFSQVDDSTTRRYEGTGLGLTITKTLVELMGGRITVRSRPGQGSIFRVTLNLGAVAGTVPIAAGGASPVLAGRRLLIDLPGGQRRRLVRELAYAWGMQAFLAEEAAATENNFDVILRQAPAPGVRPPAPRPGDAPVLWLSTQSNAALGDTLHDPFAPEELSHELATLLRPAAATASEPVVATGRKLGERLPLRILSADDIATNRDLLRFLCTHLGYRTDLVENGVEVLERMASHTYDLILLDMQMPVMDGLTVAREICRKFPDPAKRPKLVAVTAGVQPGDRERCLDAGMDDYLAKPLLPQHLQRCIEKMFGKGRSSNPPMAPTERSLPPWIDAEHLGAMTDGLEPAVACEELSNLRTNVINDFQALLPRLEAACAARDQGALIREIHGLKGCVLAIGWTRMGRRCAHILTELRQSSFAGWAELPAEIVALQHDSARAFDIYLATTTPAEASATKTF